jgi:tRNA threonylcarbamoyladenosine biosynthesis protein TsaE
VKELWDIRIEEFLEDGIVLVEWPGRFPDLIELPHWKVIFKLEDDCRCIENVRHS